MKLLETSYLVIDCRNIFSDNRTNYIGKISYVDQSLQIMLKIHYRIHKANKSWIIKQVLNKDVFI